MPAQPQINININSLAVISCQCGNAIFDSVLQCRLIPALYSQDGRESMLAIGCYRCTKCGQVYSADQMVEMHKKAEREKRN